jgi:hypothetical protein
MRPLGRLHSTDSSTVSSPWTPQSTQDRNSETPPIFDSSSDNNDDYEFELLTSRTRRLELDALTFTNGVGTSSGHSFRRKVEKLRDDHHNDPNFSNDPQEEPDFVRVTRLYLEDVLISCSGSLMYGSN